MQERHQLQRRRAREKKTTGTRATVQHSPHRRSVQAQVHHVRYQTVSPHNPSPPDVDADAWLAHFQRYTEYRQLSESDVIAIFPLFLTGVAIDWYNNLPANVKPDHKALINNFKNYFGKSPLDYVSTKSQFSAGRRKQQRRFETTLHICKN